MSAPENRRGFLRGLVSLPLIGGGVTLIGDPSAAAVPVSDDLIDGYSEWLFYERRLLNIERYGREGARKYGSFVPNTPASAFHFPSWPIGWEGVPKPSSRAAVVLSAVGCDWRPA